MPTKFHWLYHWAERSRWLNPRKGYCMIDEDFVGKCKTLAHSCAAGSEMHLMPVEASDKYRRGMDVCVFHEQSTKHTQHQPHTKGSSSTAGSQQHRSNNTHNHRKTTTRYANCKGNINTYKNTYTSSHINIAARYPTSQDNTHTYHRQEYQDTRD